MATMFKYYRRRTGGYAETIKPAVLTNETDAGDRKISRKYSRTLIQVKDVYILTAAQFGDFQEWFTSADGSPTGADMGSSWIINWSHPITGTIHPARIADGLYNITLLDTQGKYLQLDLNMEYYSG